MRELVARLGVELSEEILKQAITHRSFSYENGGVPTNERLEFLGDSVLGIVITDELYRKNPDAQEGQLAKLRAAVVNAKALADVARTLGLGEFLLLGKGEEATGGRDKSSILADAVEAILGAIYVEHGLAKSGEVILQLFAPILAASAELGAGLDVFEVEPTPADNPLLQLDNVVVTPHGICFTDECMQGLAESAFKAAVDVMHGKKPPHVVTS